MADLEQLVEPTTRGDPETPLRWTCKSVRQLADELQHQGHRGSHQLVSELLYELGYSLQANRKTIEGASHPDRDAQFEHINRRVRLFLRAGDPVISVDAKKKELVGNFKNGGRERRPQGNPEKVLVHDFVIPELGRAIPYGVYDLGSNTGWVSVGIDHDTATFAAESIRRWWRSMGRPLYRGRKRLLIMADAGGSNGPRVRLWKVELQRLANELGIEISVCHFPPGTSKWNEIEHRLFSFISMNWRGKLLGHRQPDRGDHNRQGPSREGKAGSQSISGRGQGFRRRGRERQPKAGTLPRRLELNSGADGNAAWMIRLLSDEP